MILPVVRERLEALLRQPALEGALAELRSGGNQVEISGLQDVAKALLASYFVHELRRPAFLITDSNRRAEAIAETVNFFSGLFPGAVGYVLAEIGELPGEFAGLGGIVDGFSRESPRPVRIELLGDTVESIREF